MKQMTIHGRNRGTGANTPAPVFEESAFKRMLSLERRRCERTGAAFALMLVELPEALEQPIDAIALDIAAAMRDTDITGWYRQSSTIGVILTALNGASCCTLESIVVPRLMAVLSVHVPKEQSARIRIALHPFPEEDGGGNGHGPNPTFYPEDEDHVSGRKSFQLLKRIIDVTGSLAALILLAPLFLIIAAVIKLTSEGPVFFQQPRIGQFGRKFTFLKFRSMFTNNDPAIHREYIRNLIDKKVADSGGTFKIKNDPRVTPIGRFLRKSSLDELPQFVNVLRGEMSLVGPRPPIPYEFESYSLWHRRRILQARPGITGEWQVHGRSRTTFDEMVRMDLRYIENPSIWTDLKLLLKTPLAVITGNGAY
jgi:lipopolysaccharide/colanic/teichoic acid biosynthesis glycosyltransferase